MNNPSGVCFAALLVLLVAFHLHNADATVTCRKKNYYCPNTTLNYDYTNPVVARTQQRLLVEAVLRSNLLPPLSATARDFINRILEHVNTDSPSELGIYYGFVSWLLPVLSQVSQYPSLCLFALNINATVNWLTTRDANASVASFRQTGASVSSLCLMLESASLTNLGCENAPDVAFLSSRCYGRGRVYAVQELLNLRGQNLPCCIYQGILDLYSSSNYVDNLIAAAFVINLSQEMQEGLQAYNMNVWLETCYMLLNNSVSVCCCPKRKARYEVLCAMNNAISNQIINDLINNRFLYDECATEAHAFNP
ncbi:uncharacterized protein LOC143918175 [Arctopsyche grandis]|uniref:uncharacterized protein LOC143918175 n=1 Tax=Arctopsyche grandis TaxID=121162 RepID=UPI00406D7A2D